MGGIARVTAFAVAAALCAVVVRRHSAEVALVLALAGVAMVLGYCLGVLVQVKAMLDALLELTGLSPLAAAPVVKTVGVAILTRFGAELCRDAQENGLAVGVETAGAAAALALAAPLLQGVLDMIGRLL